MRHHYVTPFEQRQRREQRQRVIAEALLAFACGASVTYVLGMIYLWRVGL